MTPSVDYADPSRRRCPSSSRSPHRRRRVPVDTPWERLNAQRTEIETVKPPDELVRPAGPPGIICPACRTENEASRRFCQSCGTPLVDTAPVQTVVRQPMKRSYKWLLVLIPIVLIAGVIGFGGAALLKGGLPTSSATVAPPSGGSLDARPPARAARAARPPSARRRPFRLGRRSTSCRSTRSSARAIATRTTPSGKSTDYQRGDNSTKTEWQDNASGGRDIWIEVEFKDGVSEKPTPGPVDLTSVTIFPGDQSSQTAFKQTARPKTIVFTADGGAPVKFTLKDAFGSQDLVFKAPIHVKKDFRITITDTYPGSSSQFSGICEIRFVGVNSP